MEVINLFHALLQLLIDRPALGYALLITNAVIALYVHYLIVLAKTPEVFGNGELFSTPGGCSLFYQNRVGEGVYTALFGVEALIIQ